MKKLVALFLTFIICFSFVACIGGDDIGDAVQNIEANQTVLASYESVVTLTSRVSPMGDSPAVFKSSISVKDIKLSGALSGKTVKSVKFIDKSTIEVVLDGKANTVKGDTDIGNIIVSKNALENENSAFASVMVSRSQITVSGTTKRPTTGKYNATFRLNAGSFTDKANADHIKIAEGSDGTIKSITLNDNVLVVEVIDATDIPTLRFDPETTSFNKGFSILMDNLQSVVLE